MLAYTASNTTSAIFIGNISRDAHVTFCLALAHLHEKLRAVLYTDCSWLRHKCARGGNFARLLPLLILKCTWLAWCAFAPIHIFMASWTWQAACLVFVYRMTCWAWQTTVLAWLVLICPWWAPYKMCTSYRHRE